MQHALRDLFAQAELLAFVQMVLYESHAQSSILAYRIIAICLSEIRELQYISTIVL